MLISQSVIIKPKRVWCFAWKSPFWLWKLSPSLIKVGEEGDCVYVKERNLIEDSELEFVQIYLTHTWKLFILSVREDYVCNTGVLWFHTIGHCCTNSFYIWELNHVDIVEICDLSSQEKNRVLVLCFDPIF